MDRVLHLLGDKMDEIDIALYAAERAGHIAEQVTLLRERAKAWRDYAALLREGGRDDVGAELSAQRDETTAWQLERPPCPG